MVKNLKRRPARKVTGSRKTSEKRSSAAKAAAKPADVADAKTSANIRRASDRREKDERRQEIAPVAVERRALERRVKVNRRRQIDPTTCEREYTPEELEFMAALDLYKRKSGRMFPTCSEILEVLTDMGYRRVELAASSETIAQEQPERQNVAVVESAVEWTGESSLA